MRPGITTSINESIYINHFLYQKEEEGNIKNQESPRH